MASTWKIDCSDFDPKKTDEDKINDGEGVPCRICEQVFRRLRITWRYCATCHQGFCEGEHGTFAGLGRGSCLFHGPYHT